jgi:phosphoribosylformylglycinamidine cyclo-ligase
VAASRGESAYVVDVGPFYLASIVECLGSKAIVADEMAALTGRSWYDASRRTPSRWRSTT